ncbi:MAG: Eco57I restriction-modification methylase domain-containing protein [Planctomycetia bacterium]|nr:Eco57I restriction-modification methylase domain-containing protein [Planctomycetia bacterium]
MAELAEYAAERQRAFDDSTSAEERKERGHFGTPSAIARFMAGMFPLPAGTIRVLDPGAGVGVLSAAVCERVLKESAPRRLFIELWENDRHLGPYIRQTMARCGKTLRDVGHELEYVLREEDFILANASTPLFGDDRSPSFQVAILNPPYFKLRKDSVQARAMSHVVHGQPNIYALFMAAAADMLLPGGQFVAITPRSYFNGPYFKRFRKYFFDQLTARHIHVFDSRTEAFREDAVLQENVILLAEKHGEQKDVALTTSRGRDLFDAGQQTVPYGKLIDVNGDRVVRLTTNHLECEVVAAMDALPQRFRDLGLEISTGPVVTFRSTEFLRDEPSANTAPLLWMHNVRPFVTRFPPKNGKPTHIVVSAASRRLLVPARTYVLLKRFTAKEEKRRLVAGIVTAADSYSEWLGLENHLNYVYRQNADLSRAEAFGLAAYFNSALVDRYFRAISGNTQVNATEIRGLPMPDARTLDRLGEEIEQIKNQDCSLVESVVGRAMGLDPRLIEQLVEAA